MAMILITHDLGVVAGVADRVNIMYAGQIVESAAVDDVFQSPRHPYTLGLLRSIPRVERGRRERLVPIEGLPPDLAKPPRGCPFQQRCSFRVERCIEHDPELETVLPAHEIACWVDVTGGGDYSRRTRQSRLAGAAL